MMDAAVHESIQRDLMRFEPLISKMFGVIHSVALKPIVTGGPRLFRGAANGFRTSGSKLAELGSGVSLDANRAILSALGEAIERYSAVDRRQVELVRGRSRHDLIASGTACLDPSVFNYLPVDVYDSGAAVWYDDQLKIDWIRGFYIDTRERVMIPAAAGFYGYEGFKQSTTNGLACANSETGSIENALLEVIERDAFAKIWWTKSAWTEIDWRSSEDVSIRQLNRQLGPWAKSVRLFSPFESQHLHTAFAIYHPSNSIHDIAFALAGASSLRLESAIEKAICELADVYLSTRPRLEKIKSRKFDPDWNSSILNFVDAVDLYGGGQNGNACEFLLAPSRFMKLGQNKGATPLVQVGEALRAGLQHCGDLNARPIAMDLTTSDVRKCGLFVHRVIVPELLPLNGAHAMRPVQHRRLQRPSVGGGVVNLSESGRSNRGLSLNKMPHPFP